MHYLDVTLPTLAENLALDEALLLEAEDGRGGEILRLWEWPTPAVVLGAACRLKEDVDETACNTGGVPILRRSSGGGTVLLGGGCLLYSLVLGYERSPSLCEILQSFAYILGHVRDGLQSLSPGIELAGTSDLAVAGRKVSGNSQQRKRHYLLHHGTLLYGMNIAAVGRYLRTPLRQPHYRAGRSHDNFLANLDVSGVAMKQCLTSQWNAQGQPPGLPEDRLRRLVTEKYGTPEWIRRL